MIEPPQTQKRSSIRSKKGNNNISSTNRARPRDGRSALPLLCARFHRLERVIQGSWELEDERPWKRAIREQEILSKQIAKLRPTRLYEFQQIARALVGWTSGMPVDEIADLSGRDSHLLCYLLTSLVDA